MFLVRCHNKVGNMFISQQEKCDLTLVFAFHMKMKCWGNINISDNDKSYLLNRTSRIKIVKRVQCDWRSGPNSTVTQKGSVFLRMLFLLLLCNNSVEARDVLCIEWKVSLVNKSDTLIWVNMFLMVLISLNKVWLCWSLLRKKRGKKSKQRRVSPANICIKKPPKNVSSAPVYLSTSTQKNESRCGLKRQVKTHVLWE